MGRTRRNGRSSARTALLACAAASALAAAALGGCSASSGQPAAGQGSSGAGGSAPAVRATSPGHLGAATGGSAAAGLPRPAHVVVVMEENHGYSDIIGSPSAPYFNALASQGALFTDSSGVAHPSQPNYLALFSGSTQGITDDSCPHTFGGGNLASEAIAAHLTFAGYSESMPNTGFTGCLSGSYERDHNPWSDFPNVPASDSRTFASFPRDYANLPAISFVIPNVDHNMHNGTISQADSWLSSNLSGYAQWARSHNSLLVVDWDENDGSDGNHIVTMISGAHVRTGRYGGSVNHYNMLRTIEDLYGLPHLGASASAAPLTGGF